MRRGPRQRAFCDKPLISLRYKKIILKTVKQSISVALTNRKWRGIILSTHLKE